MNLTEIFGIGIAIIIGYVTGYIINILAASYVEVLMENDLDYEYEREQILRLSIIWPILLPINILIIIGVLVIRTSRKIMDGVSKRHLCHPEDQKEEDDE